MTLIQQWPFARIYKLKSLKNINGKILTNQINSSEESKFFQIINSHSLLIKNNFFIFIPFFLDWTLFLDNPHENSQRYTLWSLFLDEENESQRG
jgi:hypothetical protein